jgi:NNP family nitrate/nitrite transporter-like MFS transporter
MVVPGAIMLVTGVAYCFLTKDTADGNFDELRARGQLGEKKVAAGAFLEASRDSRVWALAVLYGACFGIELTIDNVAALYFADYFQLDLKTAGIAAGLFGGMNIFARALGGWVSDKCGLRWGLRGRTLLLGGTILLEGLALMAFSQVRWLPLAIVSMLVAGLFVKMSNGATYSVVPFVNRRALGAVAGIVGAGGNIGAVVAGFLFKVEGLSWPQAILIIGAVVASTSVLTLMVRFPERDEDAARHELETRLAANLLPAPAGD